MRDQGYNRGRSKVMYEVPMSALVPACDALPEEGLLAKATSPATAFEWSNDEKAKEVMEERYWIQLPGLRIVPDRMQHIW